MANVQSQNVEEDTFKPDKYQAAAIEAAKSGASFFLTGSAGTGKTFVLRRIIHELRLLGLKVAVSASTGCAAVAIRGNTVHSISGVGIGKDSLPFLRKKAQTRRMIKQLTQLDVLIIDEISMIDAFLFDKIEFMFSTARENMPRTVNVWNRKRRRSACQSDVFGGIQVIVCGDFFQLPPVSSSDHRFARSSEKYFAFESSTWKKLITKTFNLMVVHRQSDRTFVGLLNEIRHGVVSQCTKNVLEACRIEQTGECLELDEMGNPIPFTKLFSYRRQVADENYSRMKQLTFPGVKYTAKDCIEPKKLGALTYNAALSMLQNVNGLETLDIKERCRVLCLKNIDPEMGIVNGSAGYVVGFRLSEETRVKQQEEWALMSEEERKEALKTIGIDGNLQKEQMSLKDEKVLEILQDVARDEGDGFLLMDGEFPAIVPIVRFDHGVVRCMEPEKWDVYGMDGSVIATRMQIPLTMGWALSIHKAQGMTLKNVETDVSTAFDCGQVYVALSRATSAHGLRLGCFYATKVRAHKKVVDFYKQCKEQEGKKTEKKFKVAKK